MATKGRTIDVNLQPPVNSAEGAGATVPGAAPQPLAPFDERSGWTEGDPSRTIPAMRPSPPEAAERLPGDEPPDRSR